MLVKELIVIKEEMITRATVMILYMTEIIQIVGTSMIVLIKDLQTTLVLREILIEDLDQDVDLTVNICNYSEKY